jgi:hypothetical protein
MEAASLQLNLPLSQQSIFILGGSTISLSMRVQK